MPESLLAQQENLQAQSLPAPVNCFQFPGSGQGTGAGSLSCFDMLLRMGSLFRFKFCFRSVARQYMYKDLPY